MPPLAFCSCPARATDPKPPSQAAQGTAGARRPPRQQGRQPSQCERPAHPLDAGCGPRHRRMFGDGAATCFKPPLLPRPHRPSDSKKKKAAAKKAGGKALKGSASASQLSEAENSAANGLADVLEEFALNDRSTTGVLTSHPQSRDIHFESFSLLYHGHELLADTQLELNYGRCVRLRSCCAAHGLMTRRAVDRGAYSCLQKMRCVCLACRGPPARQQLAASPLPPRRRYGLIGPNGCGKSCLLKALGARDLPIPEHIDVYLLDREIPATDLTALEVGVRVAVGVMHLLVGSAAHAATIYRLLVCVHPSARRCSPI